MRPSLSGVHLWLLLWRATKATERVARASVKATGLCLSDFGILEALIHKGPLPVGALISKILISSGSLTAAVDRLENSGLVERRPAERDRRARIVHLTADGKAVIEPLFAEHVRDMEEAFAGFNESERAALASALRKLQKRAMVNKGETDE
jgi:MarR family transcriptional regulator, 2-MHQ and catechol-resistance regulon repressor